MLKTGLIYFASFIFFWVVLPAFLVVPGLFLDRLFNLPQLVFTPYNSILALSLILFGSFWAIWALFSLVKIGKGNPQEFFGKEILPATKKLVIVGPYHHTRNPIIFGWYLLVVGIGVYFGSISVLLIILPVFTIADILYLKHIEEKNLIKRFGEDYIRYRKKMPMIIPRIFK